MFRFIIAVAESLFDMLRVFCLRKRLWWVQEGRGPPQGRSGVSNYKTCLPTLRPLRRVRSFHCPGCAHRFVSTYHSVKSEEKKKINNIIVAKPNADRLCLNFAYVSLSIDFRTALPSLSLVPAVIKVKLR